MSNLDWSSSQAIRDLYDLPPTISVEEAGRILGVSRPTAYEGAALYLESGGREGIPVIRVTQKKLRVPTALLLRQLGLAEGDEAADLGSTAPTTTTDPTKANVRSLHGA